MNKFFLFIFTLFLTACVGGQKRVVGVDTATAMTDNVGLLENTFEGTSPEMESDTLSVVSVDDEAVLNRYYHQNGPSTGRNHPDRKVVYLTFDDGPSPTTSSILDVLREEGVRATFFVTAQCRNYLDWIGQEYREGHAVAAHTYSHRFRIYSTLDSYFQDLNRIRNLINSYTGQRPKVIRFPGGSSNRVYFKHANDSIYMFRLTQAVLDSGYQYVDWNVDSRDASGVNIPVETIVRNSCRSTKNDICILMHDAVGKATTVKALPTIIRYYKEHGYEFGTLTSTSYVCHHSLHPYRPEPVKMVRKFKQQKRTQKDSAIVVTRDRVDAVLEDVD